MNNNISTFEIGEGITYIPRWTFYNVKATNMIFPSTVADMDMFAFEKSTWIKNLNTSVPGYTTDSLRYVDVEINGHMYSLVVRVEY